MFRLGSRHWIRPKVLFAAAGTAAVLLAAGGTALAVTPGSTAVSHGQVNGCYARASGALRVLTAHAPHCKPSEKAISWPQTPNSISGLASTFKFKIGKALTTSLEPVTALKLAPGSYIVSATADLETVSQTSPFDWAQCEVLDGKVAVIGFALTTIPYDSSFGFGFSTLAANAYSAHGGVITLKCSDESDQAILFDWELTATQVNRLALGPNTTGAAPHGTAVKLPSAG
jgi:hypothetical protein